MKIQIFSGIFGVLLCLLCFSVTVEARSKNYYSMCAGILGDYNLNCGKKSYYQCRCKNPVYVTSMMNCYSDYNLTEKALKVESKSFFRWCDKYGNVTTSLDEWKEIYNKNKDSLITMDEFGTNLTKPLTSPIIFDAKNLTLAYKTITVFYFEYYLGEEYGYVIIKKFYY